MKPGYKEKIIMHSLYPKRMHSSDITIVKYLLFYSCMVELAERKILRADGGRLWCNNKETGDPVLDSVIAILLTLSGKSLSRLQLMVPQKAGGIYKKQMNLMTDNNFLTREDIRFISWKIGSRYTVRKYDLLKPGITKLERSLVYGREPDRETWLMAMLLEEGKLFGNIFTIREFHNKAIQRQKLLFKTSGHGDRTISLLIQSLRKTMNTRKAITMVSKG